MLSTKEFRDFIRINKAQIIRLVRKAVPLLTLIIILSISAHIIYNMYNIYDTNKDIDSLLRYNYYQGNELNEYVIAQIDNKLDIWVKEKIKEDESYAAISFEKTARRTDFFVNVFGVISVLFLGLIGLNIWDRKGDKDESREILSQMNAIKKETEDELAEIRRIRRKAIAMVDHIGFDYRATRFRNQ